MSPLSRSALRILLLAFLCGAALAAPIVPAVSRSHAASSSPEVGALLYSELACAACHGNPTPAPARQGPDLSLLADRAKPEWIIEFLKAPSSLRPGTSMPAMLHRIPGNPHEIATDLAHYLSSLRPPQKTKPKSALHANAERGGDLFRHRGCAACHPTENTPAPGLSPFPDLSRKYSLLSLAAFLESPDKARPDNRMPSLSLTPQDSLDIAAHLVGFRTSDPRQADKLLPLSPEPDRVARGADQFRRLGCSACHGAATNATPANIPLANPSAGCLNNAATNAPRFDLALEQIRALQAYLRAPASTLSDEPARWRHTAEALNCTACHAIDHIGGPTAQTIPYFTGDEALGDTGRFPPPLTKVGSKLQPPWMEGVLSGKNRKRPYIHTQMPVYANQAKQLTRIATAGSPPIPFPQPPNQTLHDAGRTLLGSQGGVNCITCHRWEGRPSLGIQAIDLHDSGQRLRRDWLGNYLKNPNAYRPNTLMPALWPTEQSSVPLLDAKSAAQIDAVLDFLERPEGLPPGLPDTTSAAFEIIPKDRPVIQRTFLKDGGAHAILVGFPAGFHLAFDGLSGTPVMLWKGRFFDAYSTWFSRQAPFESPLSEDIARWEALPTPTAPNTSGFRGYKIDASGNPTFLVTRDGLPLEETYFADATGMHRIIRSHSGKPSSKAIHPAKVNVVEVQENATTTQHFHYLWRP
jgi:cytochrome c553